MRCVPALILFVGLAACDTPSRRASESRDAVTRPPAQASEPVVVDVRSAPVRAAVASVSRERLRRDVESLAGFGTRHVLSPTDSDTRGVGAARHYLRQEFGAAAERSGGRMEVLETTFERSFGRRRSRQTGQFVNVIAHLRGNDPERGAWVFGGHYDSRNSRASDGEGDAPGADDDASGTAVILEMARVLATMELKADVYLCAFDGEELGLFGSDHFAEGLAQADVKVEGMVTNDIVGASRGPDGRDLSDVLRVFSQGSPPDTARNRSYRNHGAETEGPSRQLARYAALIGDRYLDPGFVKLIYRQDRFGRGGDHRSFNRRDYAGIRFTEGAENYEHQHQDVRVEDGVQYGDLVEYVDFDYLTRVARLNVAVAMNGAGAPPPPAEVRVRGAVRHHTTVSWSAPEAPKLTGYRVWRRATDESRWREFHFVPKGTEETVFEFTSLDDWHFAVSSVDDEGRESPMRFPHIFRPAEASK